MKVRFTVLGPPCGKGRPRFGRHGNFVKAYTPEKTVAYEDLVKLEYHRQCSGFRFDDTQPLDIRITAYYPIPASVSKRKRQAMIDHVIRPMKKPDYDNLAKIVSDALNQIAYKDDAQIVDGQVRKFYAEEPKVVITIQEAT